MKTIAKLLILSILLNALTCCGMVGPYHGPEPFGRKSYSVSPPNVNSTKPQRVVLLLFSDARPVHKIGLDWTRQASALVDQVSQPQEVREEINKAILAGLKGQPFIKLISPQTFLKTKQADLIISGRILNCEADREMGWSNVIGIGYTRLEVQLRNGLGESLTIKPLIFQKTIKRALHETDLQINVGAVADILEDSVELAAEKLVQSKALARALNQ